MWLYHIKTFYRNSKNSFCILKLSKTTAGLYEPKYVAEKKNTLFW